MKVPQLQVIHEVAKVPRRIQRQVPNDPGDATGSEARGGTDQFRNARRPRLRVQKACTALSPYLTGRTDKAEGQKDQTSVHKCKAKCKAPPERVREECADEETHDEQS